MNQPVQDDLHDRAEPSMARVYAAVIAIEALVIFLLWMLGRAYS